MPQYIPDSVTLLHVGEHSRASQPVGEEGASDRGREVAPKRVRANRKKVGWLDASSRY